MEIYYFPFNTVILNNINKILTILIHYLKFKDDENEEQINAKDEEIDLGFLHKTLAVFLSKKKAQGCFFLVGITLGICSLLSSIYLINLLLQSGFTFQALIMLALLVIVFEDTSFHSESKKIYLKYLMVSLLTH